MRGLVADVLLCSKWLEQFSSKLKQAKEGLTMGFERCELRRRHLSSRNDSRWHGNRLPIDGVTGPNRACSCNLSVGAGSASKQPLQGQLPWRNPSELTELLSCAWRQPRSNQKFSQIKALMQDWNELADEKGNFELQGTCGAGALWTWAKKLGALSNANLLPDPGSKIPSQSKGRV